MRLTRLTPSPPSHVATHPPMVTGLHPGETKTKAPKSEFSCNCQIQRWSEIQLDTLRTKSKSIYNEWKYDFICVSCQEFTLLRQKPSSREGDSCLVEGVWQRTNKTRSSISTTLRVGASSSSKRFHMNFRVTWRTFCGHVKHIPLTDLWCQHVCQTHADVQNLPQAQKNRIQCFLFLVYTHGCSVNYCHRVHLSAQAMTYWQMGHDWGMWRQPYAPHIPLLFCSGLWKWFCCSGRYDFLSLCFQPLQ